MGSIAHIAVNALAIFALLKPNLMKRRFVFVFITAAALALFSLAAHHGALELRSSVLVPPKWDFRCFWLYGRTALETHLPYNAAAMHRVAAAVLPYDPGFSREVLDVGFVYPPPSIALFAPLGEFRTPRDAAPLWYAFITAALIVQVYLLWRHFLNGDGWRGLLAAVLITSFLPLTFVTALAMGQPICVAESMFLLYLGSKKQWRQGFWLALASIVKPFVALVFLYPLLRRAWKTLLSAGLTTFVLTVAVVPIIGWTSIVSYISSPPTSRWPSYMLTIGANQSLIAWLLRTLHRAPEFTAALRDPLYLFLCALIVALTIWRLSSVGDDRDYGATVLLLAALLIYPAPGWYYGSMLSVPICLLWSRRYALPYGSVVALIFTFVEIVLTAHPTQFFAILFAWVVLCALPAARESRAPAAAHALTAS